MVVERLSATKIDTYYNCKRLFKYRFVSPPFAPPPKRAFVIGNVVHKALETFHRSISEERWAKNGESDKDVWPSIMSDCFKSAAKEHSAEAKILGMKKSDVLEIKSMLQTYLDELKASDEFPNVRYLEKYFKIKLDKLVISGKADRVDKVGGAMKVIDYKTSQQPLTTEEAFESVQLPTYMLWLRRGEKFDGKVIGEYVYLRHLGTKKARKSFVITGEHMADAIEKYQHVRWELDHDCKFIRNTQFKWCKYCEYKEHCMESDDD